MRSIVNILNGKTRFPFMVESFIDKTHLIPERFKLLDVEQTHQLVGENCIVLSDGGSIGTNVLTIYRNTNIWKYGTFKEQSGQLLPEHEKRFFIRVYFPDFSPSTYIQHTRYAVDIVTRIGLTKIVLSSKIFSTDDLLSLDVPFQTAGYGYHQYIDIDVFNPWDLMYSDDCADIRSMYCYETDYTNNCGAMLDVEITVLDDSSEESSWISSNRYSSGRNMIPVSYRDSDYMTLSLEETSHDGKTFFVSTIVFNSSYDGDLYEYIRDTYFTEIDSVIPELVVMDDENIYKISDLPTYGDIECTYVFGTDDIRFDSWEDYIDGMYITSMLRLFDCNGFEIMDIRSNNIPLTKEVFSRLIGDEITIYKDMEIKNIEVLNKIEKNIVSVARPDDYKSNIIKPVFYRSYQLEKIELHPTVTFNIGVDLDQYKSKVDNFSIQIEGMSFPEVGRVPGYVLFRINGEKLPKTNPTGTFYILDGEGILVTTGKYEYAE